MTDRLSTKLFGWWRGHRYTITDDEDGNYLATVEALPGCVAGAADIEETIEGIHRRIDAVIDEAIDSAIREGDDA